MSNEWYSSSELVNLPGLPGTVQNINARGKRENWQRRKRQGRGGGWEYHIDSLPGETQAHIKRQSAIESINAATQVHLVEDNQVENLKVKEDGLKRWSALSQNDPRKKRAQAREWILRSWAEYARCHCTSPSGCINEFVIAYKTGDIAIPPVYQEYLPRYRGALSLDRATLYSWKKRLQEQGMAGLLDGYGTRKGKSKIEQNEELKKTVLGCLVKYPHITAKKIKQYLEADKPHLNMVSIKGIDRYISNWKKENAQLWTYVTNPDKWKNVYMAATGSHFERIDRLNQVWEMDSTPGDWMLTDGRHSVLGVIDMYSRRLKFYVSKTSKAMAVCQVFRRCVIGWGLPEGVRTDNGKDYVANQFEGVLNDLEIEHEVCVPFASEEKGTIERAMRTMSHGILDLLPGFIGHNVAERKVIEARKSFASRIMTPGEVVEVAMSSEELQEKLDQWTDHVYQHDEHSGLENKTPWQVATSWAGKVQRIDDERALDLLLAEVAGTRTVKKKGIEFNKRFYFDKVLMEHAGRESTVKYDEQDLGRLAVYINSEFICWAVNHELTGTSRKEAAVATKAHQKKLMQQQAAELKQYKRDISKNLPEVILQHRIEQSEKLAAFPAAYETVTTPALESITNSLKKQPVQTELSNRQKAILDEVAQDLKEPVVRRMDENETPPDRYKRWARVERQIANGEPVKDEVKQQLDRYKASTEYNAMKAFHEEFGISIDQEASN